MSETREALSAPNRLLKTLLSCLSQDWMTFVFDLYRVLRRWVQQQSHEGTYGPTPRQLRLIAKKNQLRHNTSEAV